MIQVPVGQSQLSGWGHYAEPTVLFINKVPNPFMAGQTINLSATKSAGGTELHFSDGTVLKYEESGNLVPALEGVRVWSVPAEGTIVPNGLDYVTVYASYKTKHNKTLNAVPVKVPILRPVAIRIVTDPSHRPVENYYCADSPLYDSATMPIDTSKFKTYALYAKSGSSEIVYSAQIQPEYSYDRIGSIGGGYGWVYGVRGQANKKENVTVYHSLMSPSIESFDYALEITATARINGISLTDKTYIETVPIEYFSYPFPLETGRAVFANNKIRFYYLNGLLNTPVPGLSDMWLYFSLAAPTVFNTQHSLTINFTNGSSGSIWISRESPKSGPRFEATRYDYICADGRISWSRYKED